MFDLTDINIFYLLCLGIFYLGGKLIVLRFIHKKITVRRTRIILLAVAALLSPTALTLLWLFRADITLKLVAALAAVPIDIALINGVRVLREPLSTLDDVEYDDTPTSL